MYKIPEIKLVKGSHSDIGKTGVGCFMNVIAYLNGELQITDEGECVCFVVRPIVIWLNDYSNDDQRQKLLPFILRARGSRTDDVEELSRRTKLKVEFTNKQRALAAKFESAAVYAAMKESIFQAGFDFLDLALPALTGIDEQTIMRAETLKALATV